MNLTPWRKGDKFSADHLQEPVDALNEGGDPAWGNGINVFAGKNGRGFTQRKKPQQLAIYRMKSAGAPTGTTGTTAGVFLANTYNGNGIMDPQIAVLTFSSPPSGTEFYATVPVGGTKATYKNAPVVWMELPQGTIWGRLISNATDSGTYNVAIMLSQSIPIPQNSVLESSDFGTWDPSVTFLAQNAAEENLSGHILFPASAIYMPQCFPINPAGTDTSGKPVYKFWGFQTIICTSSSSS